VIDAAAFCRTDRGLDGGAYNGETNAINLVAGSYSTQNNGNQPFTYNSTAPYALYVSGGRGITCGLALDPTRRCQQAQHDTGHRRACEQRLRSMSYPKSRSGRPEHTGRRRHQR
jgi:hypothetical protein